ncbi:M28 family peptidase [Persicimonas caeni]|uniref:M28 family peptidase n=1 Tax=Persicimonas caeni TaxID=2292766 RepID=A0A4Y6PMM7_PERCE|nr:M28 family peptidase [Persicimonas caeni]QDG49558.1 M28 family peptidase [Persicimonas caeni]QED30779.1 M28 family peptidase [Persicimonas caeni]
MKLFPEDRREWLKTLYRVPLGVAVLLIAMAGVAVFLSWMPGDSYEGELPELTGEQRALSERLRTHVEVLAADYPERNFTNVEQYRGAEAYLVGELKGIGYEVTFEEVENAKGARNIIAEREGATRPDEVIVVGAHYDAEHTNPGADDNASGTAGVVELARRFAERTPARTIRFVLFVNEEPPFFRTENMGSHVHAQNARERGDNIVLMMSLEMLGYYDDAPGSQRYHSFLKYFYPDRGNFIAFVSSLGNRAELRRSIAVFREQAKFPSEGLAAPEGFSGIDLSDHMPFWNADYPALMVTDTAFLRNTNYHKETDTPDSLDYERFARVVDGLEPVVWEWAKE